MVWSSLSALFESRSSTHSFVEARSLWRALLLVEILALLEDFLVPRDTLFREIDHSERRLGLDEM